MRHHKRRYVYRIQLYEMGGIKHEINMTYQSYTVLIYWLCFYTNKSYTNH